MNFQRIIALALLSAFVNGCSTKNNQLVQQPIPEKVKSGNKNAIYFPAGVLISNFDTVCGMNIENNVIDTITFDGKLLGFCSHECKNTFIKSQKIK